MINIDLLRDNSEKLKEATEAKQVDPGIVDAALDLDKRWRKALQVVEKLRAEKNKLSDDPTPENIKKAKRVKEDLKKAEKELRGLEEKREATLKQIPNLIAEDVPYGESEDDNKVIREWGKPPEFDFKARDHLELGEMHGIIDTEKASEVSGARFNYLLGEAVLIQFALIQYALEVLTNEKTLKKISQDAGLDVSVKPFTPVIPPVMIRPEPFDKMDRLEPSDERFFVEKDDLYLVGSAEHTLGPLHMEETLRKDEMPLRYVGYSTAFRREAGSYGKDTRGILRVHQFDKLEIETFTLAENGLKEQDFIVAIQEYLMQKLEIPYQVIAISSGDMGKPDYRQIDLNAWMPGQGKYRETHTSDYMTDYQARRLNTKVDVGGETEYVHMNDATVFAIGRTLIAILENNQEADGTINIPKVLQKYVGKEKIIAREGDEK